MSLKLNPLSTAKGQTLTCELCGKCAVLACQHCRVAFYCAKEHQLVDWFGIHEKICQLLGALRTLRPSLGSQEERQRRNLTVQMSQHALIDLCRSEAQRHLIAGEFELAIPGALQSLRFGMHVYGAGSIELMPSYMLLAEANLGCGKHKIAEEFLVYANWSMLKNPDCSNEIKSQLYRNFGKVYAARQEFDKALEHLATDVYYASLESGPEHIDTAGGFYYLGNVFLAKGSNENALTFYDKVMDIWYKFFINLRARPNDRLTDYLSEALVDEASQMIRSILELRRSFLGMHVATAEGLYVLALLFHCDGKVEAALAGYKLALSIYSAQPSEATKAITEVVELLEQKKKLQPDYVAFGFDASFLESSSSQAPTLGESKGGGALTHIPDRNPLADDGNGGGGNGGDGEGQLKEHLVVTQPDGRTEPTAPSSGDQNT